MKYRWLYTLIIFTSMAPILHANIDVQIDAIKNASVEERFKLMNAFKRNLLKMKEAERIKAITKLSEKSNKTHAKKALDELKHHTKRRHMQDSLEYHHVDDDNLITETTDQGGGENED